MRLLICMLCTGDDPFACPARFRRTYMQLHLEKSHQIVAKDLKISRVKSQQEGCIAEWMSVAGGSQTGILVELEIEVGAGKRAAAVWGQTSVQDDLDGGRMNWSTEAMQELNKGRKGQYSPF